MTTAAYNRVKVTLLLSQTPMSIIEITDQIYKSWGERYSVNSIGTRVTDPKLRKSLLALGYTIKSERRERSKPEHVYSLERV